LKKINQIEPSLGSEEKKELLSVIDSGWFTEASKTREFEKKFARFVGCKYACAVTSGTIALFVALKSLGVGKGDEVIVPDLTFVASPNAVEMTGAKPVLVDVSPNTLNIDPNKISQKISKKTKAIMPVDFNGRPVDYIQLKKISQKYDLFLIEDACHAIGSFSKNKHVGTQSDVAAFSFSTTKIITTGQGGMIITNNKQIYNQSLAIKDFGRKFGAKKEMRKAFEHSIIGYNFKFTEFQAAVGIAQIKKIKNSITKKRKIMKKYMDLLHEINEIDFIDTDLRNVTPWMIDIILKTKARKDYLIRYLEKKGIETRIFYPPIHRLKPYKKSDYEFKVTTNYSDRGMWLPSSLSLTEKQLELICKEIKQSLS